MILLKGRNDIEMLSRRGRFHDHSGYARLYLDGGAYLFGQEPPHPGCKDQVRVESSLLYLIIHPLLIPSRNKSFVLDLETIDRDLSVDEIRKRMRPLEVPFKDIHVYNLSGRKEPFCGRNVSSTRAPPRTVYC